jgi:hypothetical protein
VLTVTIVRDVRYVIMIGNLGGSVNGTVDMLRHLFLVLSLNTYLQPNQLMLNMQTSLEYVHSVPKNGIQT